MTNGGSLAAASEQQAVQQHQADSPGKRSGLPAESAALWGFILLLVAAASDFLATHDALPKILAKG